ncbi:MAG: tetratricopeptide repeat protein [Candidatus Aminicenantes bacterium]|nr:tetratricopeptide repeat protein [Candidatus Aminicenantes bacterium]
MKRTERKHLKEDEFASGLQRIYRFLDAYKMWIIAVAGIAAAGVLIFLGVRFLQDRALERRGRIETEILELFRDIDKNPESVARLEAWTAKGRTGRLAAVLLAGHWIEKGDLDKAEAVLSPAAEGPKDFLHYRVRDILGQISYRRGDYDQAIEIYRSLQAENPRDYVLDVVLFRLAEALEKKGQNSEALELYKTVRDDYIEGAFSQQAAQKVRELE